MPLLRQLRRRKQTLNRFRRQKGLITFAVSSAPSATSCRSSIHSRHPSRLPKAGAQRVTPCLRIIPTAPWCRPQRAGQGHPIRHTRPMNPTFANAGCEIMPGLHLFLRTTPRPIRGQTRTGMTRAFKPVRRLLYRPYRVIGLRKGCVHDAPGTES
jgi:hypothetical protein